MSILGGTYDALRSLPREYLGSPVFATIIPLFSFQSSYFDKEQFPVLCEGILKYYYIPVIKDRAKDFLPSEWYNLTNQNQVFYLPCFRGPWLEPYIMLRSSSMLQLFDETFVNYGFNKVQWIETLRYSGYEFYIVNDAFLVDMPHKSS